MDVTDFSSLFDWLPIGAYRVAPDGRLLRANAALARINGFEDAQKFAAAVDRVRADWYVEPGRLADLQRQLAQVGHLDNVVSEARRLNTGERIWVRENSRLVRGPDGQPVYYEGTVEDITRAQTLQAALQVTLENAGGGIALIEADGVVSYHNQRTLELLDLPQALGDAGLTTKAVWDHQMAHGHYEDHPENTPAALRDIPTRPPANIMDVTVAQQYLRRTHQGRVLQVNTQPLGGGRAVRTYVDLTDVVLSERTLAATSRNLQVVLDSMAQGLISIDADGRVVLANARARALLDLPDEVLHDGATMLDLLRFQHARGDFGPDAQHAEASVRAFLKTGAELNLSGMAARHRRQRPDGRWIEIQSVPRTDGGFVRTYTDVTDEVEAQQSLRTQHLHLQALVETHPDRIWAKDKEGRYTLVNAAQAKFHGLSISDFLGRDDIELFGPEQGKAYSATDHLTQRDGRAYTEEYSFTDAATGRLAHFKVTKVALLNAQGEIVGTVGAARDVTVYRQAQRAAEDAARSKASFLATMSHELRTPLNAVLGMANLMADTPLDPRQQEFIDIIRRSGDQLLALINDVLDYSRIESGRLTVESIALDLAECVHDTVDTVAGAAVAKGLEITAWIDPALPRTVLGDPMRIKQVLLNLVSNAVKFTHQGVVSVRADLDVAGTVRIAVQDSGIGIPAEGVQRLFEVFSQVDASTTRRFGGSGLGLAISKRLVEHMGGRIDVRSEPGAGSTFTCFLPLQAPWDQPADAAPAPEPPAPVPATKASRRVAVASGRAHHRDHFLEQLRALGHAAQAYDGPLTPAELLKRAAPGSDAVVLDWPSLTEAQRQSWTAALPTWAGPMQVLVAAPADQYPDRGFAWGQGGWVQAVFLPLRRPRLAKALASTALPAAPASAVAQAPKPTSATSAPPTKPAASGAALRMLMAEDNSINQRVATLILSKLGYGATVVDDGEKAVQALQAAAAQGTPFDVVLMDVQMPVMSGTDATTALRQLLPAHQQPWVIAMTANAMDSDRQACMDAGMDDFVSKPIEPPVLARALARARMAGQRHLN